jgi:hypothetical protein
MTTTFENARVGDKVWDYLHGWGEISEVSPKCILFNTPYPLAVTFEDCVLYYTLSGYQCNIMEPPRTLFWDEIKYEIPKAPERIRTKIILNDWGRRTYKTTEAIRIRENFIDSGKSVILLTELPEMSVQMQKQHLTHICCTLHEMEFENGNVCEPKRVSTIPIKGRVFIFDEPCLKSDGQDLLRVIKGLGENNALEVHVYGELGEDTCACIQRMSHDTFDVFINRRDTPFDAQEKIAANCM